MKTDITFLVCAIQNIKLILRIHFAFNSQKKSSVNQLYVV